MHPGRTITYGVSTGAHVRATNVELTPEVTRFTIGQSRFSTRLPGTHSISNILAAVAVATAFDMRVEDMVDIVAALAPEKMRGRLSYWRGVLIIDDCYDSN